MQTVYLITYFESGEGGMVLAILDHNPSDEEATMFINQYFDSNPKPTNAGQFSVKIQYGVEQHFLNQLCGEEGDFREIVINDDGKE